MCSVLPGVPRLRAGRGPRGSLPDCLRGAGRAAGPGRLRSWQVGEPERREDSGGLRESPQPVTGPGQRNSTQASRAGAWGSHTV